MSYHGRVLAGLFVAALLMTTGQTAMAQSQKLGYIDLQRLVFDTKVGKAGIAEIKAFQEARQKDISVREKELLKMKQDQQGGHAVHQAQERRHVHQRGGVPLGHGDQVPVDEARQGGVSRRERPPRQLFSDDPRPGTVQPNHCQSAPTFRCRGRDDGVEIVVAERHDSAASPAPARRGVTTTRL